MTGGSDSASDVRLEVSEGVATVTLDRPERMNALSDTMLRRLRQAMTAADADPEVRVIVLTGAGRAFCAGYDVGALGALTAGGALEIEHPPYDPALRPDYQTQHTYFMSLSKPVVAAINGPAAGLGMVLALYADVRIASDLAFFTTSFAARGLIAEHGVAWILPQLIGLPRAMELLLSARRCRSDEALRIGLVTAVHPAAEFGSAVAGYAKELASTVSPRSLRVIKRQVLDARFQTLHESVASANQAMLASMRSADFAEGVAHFVERRPPRFTGVD
jgi:enoyl-CoA hydratase/carnithine racemase